jgi:hypothetical protein
MVRNRPNRTLAAHPVAVQTRPENSPEWEEFRHDARAYRTCIDRWSGLMTSDNVTSGPQPRQYEIHVHGHLGETIRAAFPALRAQPRGEDTVLTGALPDQAALYGVLAEIEALGLELLEVRRRG